MIVINLSASFREWNICVQLFGFFTSSTAVCVPFGFCQATPIAIVRNGPVPTTGTASQPGIFARLIIWRHPTGAYCSRQHMAAAWNRQRTGNSISSRNCNFSESIPLAPSFRRKSNCCGVECLVGARYFLNLQICPGNVSDISIIYNVSVKIPLGNIPNRS